MTKTNNSGSTRPHALAHTLSGALTRTLAVAPLAFFLACGGGGGGDKPTGPAPVTSVELTAPSTSLEVGAIMLISAKYFDSKHNQLSGKTVAYSSSNSSFATVDQGGTVTGVAPGAVTITANVDGASNSVSITIVPVPVASVVITPKTPSVRQGETTTLTAQPVDAIGRPLSGRAVAWTSANPVVATVNASGVVSGVAAGTAYIRAESEGKRDSVSLRVKSLNAPNITGNSGGTLTPGATGTVTGVNFGPTPNDNAVFVNGTAATVSVASATSVSFVVPAVTALPCTPTGPSQVMLVANGDTTVTSMQLRMATPRTLALGQSALWTSQSDLQCNEFAVTGGRYLVTAFNYAPDAAVKTSFELLGASPVAASQTALASVRPSLQGFSPSALFDNQATSRVRAHLAVLKQQQAFSRQMGSPRLRERMALKRRTQLALGGPPPAPVRVGDMTTFRMQQANRFGNYTVFDNVRFRAVYVGSKIIMYEDSLAPLAGTMDAEYQRMGQEFDNVTWPVLQTFGNPLVVDSALDNNGHLNALFSPRVNNYISGLLGFVTLCDFFPRVTQNIDGMDVPPCPASNEGETFYAIVPTSASASGTGSIDNWRRNMRSTLAHESKHITSYAERYYRNADIDKLEETWLEEATAQISSEIFSRVLYNKTQLADLRWTDGPQCDFATVSTTCPDPFLGILDHYEFLYDAYQSVESKAVIDASDADPDRVIYGYSWSFVRWVADTYASNEQTFFRSLVQVQNDHGVPNLESKSGHPFSELLGYFSLACLADDYPNATINDARIRLPSWNSRDIFLGMNQHLFFSGGAKAFPLEFPLTIRTAPFGTFSNALAQVALLPGGGFAAWDISGTQAAPQVLAVRDSTGGLPPTGIGMAIVRVQ